MPRSVYVAPDGTHWMPTHPDSLGWTGWVPGEDGVWLRTDAEFHASYPDAPKWRTDDAR
jgi:hypothetical protein